MAQKKQSCLDLDVNLNVPKYDAGTSLEKRDEDGNFQKWMIDELIYKESIGKSKMILSSLEKDSSYRTIVLAAHYYRRCQSDLKMLKLDKSLETNSIILEKIALCEKEFADLISKFKSSKMVLSQCELDYADSMIAAREEED